MAAAAGAVDAASTIATAVDALQASASLLKDGEGGGEVAGLLDDINALTAKLTAFNQSARAAGAVPKATASVMYKSGTGLIDKPGGCLTIVFQAKPATTDTDLGKLTGRVKALFMAVPKEMKHKMATFTTAHPDGLKRWSIEIKFPYGTLEKANNKFHDDNKHVSQGIAMVKDYLENSKQADAIPFTTTVQVGLGCTVASLVEFFDPSGDYRSQVGGVAGPEASVPKQVERFHAELLQHIEAIDSVSLRTQERELRVGLGSVRLADLFSQPSEEVPKVEVDLHPMQEVVGGLGLSMVGTAVLATDKILYRNDIDVEASVENTTPSDAPYGLAYEDVSLDTADGVTLHCWFVKGPEPAQCTVVYFHGNAGDMASRLTHVQGMQQSLKCNVFMVSYRGYGKSTGKPSEEGLMEDAKAALKYLAEKPEVDTKKIVVYGHSVGGAVGIHLVAQSGEAGEEAAQPAALIVENAFTSIAEMAGPLFRRVGNWLPSQWKNHEEIQKITCPILFLSGRSDTIVPPEMMDLLKCAATSSASATMIEFPDKGHNDTWTAEEYYGHLEKFVTENVK